MTKGLWPAAGRLATAAITVVKRSRPSRSTPKSASPSRAWPAMYFCWVPLPGASAASSPAACAWKTRRGRRPRFRSGTARPRDARWSFRASSRGCARTSSRTPPLNGCSAIAASTVWGLSKRRNTLWPAEPPWERCRPVADQGRQGCKEYSRLTSDSPFGVRWTEQLIV